ncbi:phage tail protein [Streptomyces flavofungini]|uniref:phage tail protein n=1 Tax=Streptomyces flavofungini TaxID=68200 RepID=UPI0025AFF7B7|nr:phage tail protein [Streptomyces flavofungini]WJV47654.1 phage tail protein [Streptomyces flavofungini]
MENRAQATTRALLGLRAAGNIRVTATYDDQVTGGVASSKAALRDLKAQSPVRVTATYDDQVRSSVASAKAALRDLKAQSPVRLGVTFDGRASQITAAASAMRDLRSDARGADAALGSLATRSVATAAALNTLEQQAEDASRALRTLRGRAAAAAAAMDDLRTRVAGAANALRIFSMRAQTADGRLSDLSDRTRTLRSDSDDLDASMRRLTTTLAGLRGSLGTLRTSSGGASVGMSGLVQAALLLAPALIPIAAAAVPVAGNLVAAGVAVGAFGLAIGGQVAAMAKASEAEKKYKDAVKEHGRTSEEAAKAENAYLRQVRDMDPATRRAAAALGVFKDQYKAWSNSLAGDTMPVVTKGLGIFGALLPRLTPLVRTTSSELDRLMTVLAGGVNSSGFERLMDTFSQFAGGVLSRATDGLVHFMRVMSGGAGAGQFGEFMSYVREVGPQVAETLGNLSRALVHVVAAASDVGVGVLAAVNAFAQLINAIPTDVLSTLLQFVVVFKAVSLAAAGLGAAGGGIAAFGASLAAMRAASVAAGGGLAGLAAAFGALSRAAKVSVVAAGIGLVAVAVSKLSNIGKKAPPDVDKLTTSLANLGRSGKATGYVAEVFGKGFEKLHDQVKKVTNPSVVESINNWGASISGGILDAGDATEEFTKSADAVDKSLTDLVRGGKADLAKAALADMLKGWDPKEAEKFRSKMDGFKDALADQRREAELTAQSMGVFGMQSLAVQEKLAAQKQSADALRQSIVALNDVHRSASEAMNAFEQSIDDAMKAAGENSGALRMVDGHLDLNSKRARDAEASLRGLAKSTDEAATAARQADEPWTRVNGIYERGREKFVAAAHAMGLSRAEAVQLAKQMQKIPDSKKLKIEMRTEDAVAGLDSVISAMKKTPKSKSVTVKALTRDAVDMLKSLGLKVTRMKDGSFRVTAKTGAAHSSIGAVRRARDGLKDKTISIRAEVAAFRAAVSGLIGRTLGTSFINVVYRKSAPLGAALLGGMRAFGASGGLASGLPRRRFAGGGAVQAFPSGGYVQGPGGPTSDSILAGFGSGAVARVSDSEYVVQARAVKKYGVRFLDALNDGQLKIPGLARGGLTKAQQRARQRAKERAEAESRARKEATGELTVSYFGQRAGYRNPEIRNQLGAPDSLGDLTSSLNKWRSIIKRATHGGVERSLLRSLTRAGRSLISHEKKILGVNKALDKAKDKLGDLRSAASQLRSGVKDRVVSDAGITRAAGAEDARLTINTLLSQMTGSAASAKQFASMLKSLKSRGLSKDLIAQIAEAGVEGGGLETAAAVLGGGKGEIKRLNALQKEIVSAAGSAGKTAADAMYGAGIKAAEGLVKGLQKKQDKIEKQMMKIAKSMEKAIKRALKIKSPSQVMEEVGDFTAEGFAQGMRRNRSVTPAWESMLNAPPVSARGRAPAGGAPGGVQPIVVHQTITLDGRVVAQQIFDPLRKEVAHRGGNVQSALGRP